MKIKKDTILYVRSDRKGNFKAKAAEDFDTDDVTFYPVIALERVEGLANSWEIGEKVTCRKGLSTIEILSTGK